MLVSGGKIRKKIEDKFDFKFKNLQIIGYLNRNKYSNGKIFDTIICKNRENIYMIEICDAKIEIVKKYNISVLTTQQVPLRFSLIEKNFITSIVKELY